MSKINGRTSGTVALIEEAYKKGRADERAKVLEVVNGVKIECMDYFKDIDFYYNACGMKDSLEEYWDDVIESIKEQENE